MLALPSLKEGWGLVVGEAGMHGTPTVAYRAAGGTRESVDDGASGLLVDDPAELVTALGAVLGDAELRAPSGAGARDMSHRFTWDHAQESFALVVRAALRGRVQPGPRGPGAGLSRRGSGRELSCRAVVDDVGVPTSAGDCSADPSAS